MISIISYDSDTVHYALLGTYAFLNHITSSSLSPIRFS
nr:MAG TPA: hypothetical protein [Crassvirales sp.]